MTRLRRALGLASGYADGWSGVVGILAETPRQRTRVCEKSRDVRLLSQLHPDVIVRYVLNPFVSKWYENVTQLQVRNLDVPVDLVCYVDDKWSSGVGGWTITSAGSYQAGEWHHVCAVREGGTMNLYVNGTLQAFHVFPGTVVYPGGCGTRL
jgi:hypothetical protein